MEEPRRKVWDKPSARRLPFFVRLPNDDEVGLVVVVDVSEIGAAMTVVVVVAFNEGVVGTSVGVTEVSLREAAGEVGAASEEEHRRVLRIKGSTLRGSMGQAKSSNGIYTSSIKCKNQWSLIDRSIRTLTASNRKMESKRNRKKILHLRTSSASSSTVCWWTSKLRLTRPEKSTLILLCYRNWSRTLCNAVFCSYFSH